MDERIEGLAEQEGWQIEEYAARVHYRGADQQYSVEFYAPRVCVVFRKLKGGGEGVAVPVGRETVPEPLRTRIRRDLEAAGVDPAIERRVL
jgi:hypothetical protein